MKGLILKDFLNLKSFGKVTALIMLMYVGFSLYSNQLGMVSAFMFVFCAMLPLSSQTVDDQSKWNAYAQCMPVTRGQVVLSRYLVITFLLLAAVVFGGLVAAVAVIRGGAVWVEVVSTLAVIVCIILVFNAIVLPVMYKLGAEKARIVTVIVLLLCGAPFMLGWVSEAMIESVASIPLYLLPVAAIVLCVISYFISAQVYRRKEL